MNQQKELFARPEGGMKVLSLWEPWASFVALGYKMNETRSWPTKYRGELAIQAAKNRSALGDADDILEAAGFDLSDRTTVGGTKWPLGSILCVVDLVDCVLTEKIKGRLSRRELAMGDYSDGRFAWVFQNIRKLKQFVPIRGFQGIFNLGPDVSEIVRRRT